MYALGLGNVGDSGVYVIKNFFTKQFLVFLAVGSVAALLHWSARLLLNVWMPFAIAVIVAYGVGITVGFMLNSVFVFPNSEKPKRQQMRDFVLVNLTFFPVVWLASLKINDYLKSLGMTGYSEELAHALAIPLPVVATFLIYKFFAFKEGQYEQQ